MGDEVRGVIDWRAALLAILSLLLTPLSNSQAPLDWGQTVQSQLSLASNHNIIIDMTTFQGPYTSSVNPFANLSGSANVVVKVGCYNIITLVPWVIKASHVHIEFCSPQSQLAAGVGFPATSLITVGDNTIPIQDVLIEGGYLNCNGVTGCTAYQGNSLNEFTGLRHVNVGHTRGAAAVAINGITQTMGHYTLEDVQVVDSGAGDCIYIQANGVNQHRVRDITCNNAAGTPQGLAGIHITSVGTNGTNAVVEKVHVEGYSDGVYFDNRVTGSIRDVDCTNGCKDAVRIGQSCSDVLVEGVTVTTAPNLIVNGCSGRSVPRVAGGIFRTLAFYAQSNYGGNPAKAVYWNGLAWVIQ